ncbi:MAG: NAD(+) synthase, partial [Acidobacteriota bacterium]|nr:NAD(+) synthase [Acidobacteriota bacterium]
MSERLHLDYAAETDRICEGLQRAAIETFRRPGFVVAISGGVDSAVCAALAARAIGPRRVLALMLPERASSPSAMQAAETLAGQLDIPCECQDISPTLEAIGCYRAQTEALRSAIEEFHPEWKFKLVVSDAMSGRVGVTRVVVEDGEGRVTETRLPAAAYLKLVAATNFKQRVRKTLEYYHADRLNYLV